MKLIAQNINLMLTYGCNFRCKHCLRGESKDICLNKKVIRKIAKEVYAIESLHFNGGEVFTKPKLLEETFMTLMEKNIPIYNVLIVTNGTLFTEEAEETLNMIDRYIRRFNRLDGRKPSLDETYVRVILSVDEYHESELKRINEESPETYERYVENINRLRKSRFFFFEKSLNAIINSGRAKALDVLKVEQFKHNLYYYLSMSNSVMLVNYLGIDTDGNICDTNGEMPPSVDRIHGNILTSSIKDIVESCGIKCYTPDELFNKFEEDQRSLANHLNTEVKSLPYV